MQTGNNTKQFHSNKNIDLKVDLKVASAPRDGGIRTR